MIEVLKCGTIVVIKLANVKGMITASNIRFDSITYEVTYYEGVVQHCIWVRYEEMELNKEEVQKIGFIK